ncbi:hypothetical protein [Terrisporobacter mayombei]|uniref:hypothetical protein n=1 Tax=Terrisporobacter mayombei TaxID=1541 RepID=UPI002F4137BC
MNVRLYINKKQDKNAIADENLTFYPQDVDGSFHGANRDFHTAYYGEIINSYIIQ